MSKPKVIIKDLNHAWGLCQHLAERRNTHFDAIQLMGECANDGVLMNQRRGEVTNGWADLPRAELYLPERQKMGEDTYYMWVDLNLPPLEQHRKTLAQVYPIDPATGKSYNKGPTLTLVHRYGQLFIAVHPVDQSQEKVRWLLPDQSCHIKGLFIIHPEYIKWNGDIVYRGDAWSGWDVHFKIGLYTEWFDYDRSITKYSGTKGRSSYPGWREDLAFDWVQYNNWSIARFRKLADREYHPKECK